MGLHAILLLLVCYHLLFHDRVQCNWNLSREEYFDIDKQIKLLNKPAMKTITINSVSLNNKTRDQDSSNVEVSPVGSIPIRRITKNDLVRERRAYEDRLMDATNRLPTYLAIARSKRGQGNYAGVGCSMTTHNPKVSGRQFSATRIKLQNGPNSIEAGWRVDPTLYGDSRTRLFVRTDAGGSHCFNTLCPGFVHTNREVPLDHVLSTVSVPGGPTYQVPIRIIRDNGNGNWNFIIGGNNTYLGFWPSSIFPGLASYVEWGGAAYSPPDTPLPPMGSGHFPVGNTEYDSFIYKLFVVNEKGQTVDANDIETHADDSSLYSVRDLGQHGRYWGRVIFYGGPGSRKN